MSTEPKTQDDTRKVAQTGIMNWSSALMLVLWLLLILGLSGIEMFQLLNITMMLGTIMIAAIIVTAWSIFRFIKSGQKNS